MGNLQLAPGRLFANRFELERTVGSGGMGTVYRAHDRFSGEVVALKLLHPGSSSASEVERFRREGQFLSELQHPGIVSYVVHGQTIDGQRFLAMEWLDGLDLGARLMRGPLSVRDSILLIGQVADALSLAHQRGVIHRDLKPTNLFLCNGEVTRVKILDFGIARRMASQAMTQTGIVIGTPEYMAPEQARGSQDLTPAADLFSLGCVLYECLTGTPPFVADHIAAVLVRILFEEPPLIEERLPGISASLAELINRLLRKEPSQRLSDAGELRTELTKLGELPEPGLAVTLASPRLPLEKFAEQEQSLFSIVLAAPKEQDRGLGAPLPGSGGMLNEVDRQALLKSISELGSAPDFLANDSLVVTVPSSGSAQDQATRAARVALLIKDSWPAAVIALATGQGVLRGRSAVGAVVERAAGVLQANTELSESCAASGIHVDTLSARLLEGRFALTPRLGGALLLYEEREMDASRPLLGKPTPCVGREAELSWLDGQLGACIEESEARVVLCTAPPGTGKSRLRHEFMRNIEKRKASITVLLGRGDLLQAGAAYHIVSRSIHALCNIEGWMPVSEQCRRLQERIERHLSAEVKRRVVPLLGELCGIPFPEDEFPALKEIRQQPKNLPNLLHWAALTWLTAECQAAPVLFILDDLHWGDALSIGFIDEALDKLCDAQLFVFALARPVIHTIFPSLWKKHRPLEIALKGLSKRACERLIQQVLGKKIAGDYIAWMVEQSTGNALFLEELIRAAEDQPKERPETVIAMLQSRIGHLEERIRHAVLAAAIFGQTFWDVGVASILGLPAPASDVEAWLSEAVETELIEPHRGSRFAEQQEYGFRHGLVRDAAYSLLSDSDRKIGHQRAAEYLARSAGQQIPHALLGYHYLEAELFDKALHHYREAGDGAAKQILYEEAMLHYQRAEEALRHLPHTTTLQREFADLLLSQVQCSFTAAPPPLTWKRLAQSRELLDGLDQAGANEPQDRLRRARLDYESGKLHTLLEQYAQAAVCFDRVLPIAEEFHDHQLGAQVRTMYGRTFCLEGQIARAIVLLEPCVALIERYLGMDIDTARAYSYLAIVLGEGGRGRSTRHYLELVHKWLEKHEDVKYLMTFHTNLCVTYMAVCDFPAAIHGSKVALEFAEKSNEPLFLYLAYDMASWTHARLGELEIALKYRLRAVELRAHHGSAYQKAHFEANHAEILLKQGHGEAARELAKSCTLGARECSSMRALSFAERIWGCALAKLGAPPVEVDMHLGESLSVAKQVGNVMEALRTKIAWADVLLERKEHAAATALFRDARACLNDEMLPCTHEHFLPLIDDGLRRCETSACHQ